MRLAAWLAVVAALVPGWAGAEVHPWAGLGSLVVPGVGQAAQNRYGSAAAHGGLWLGSALGAASLAERADYLDADARADEADRTLYYNRPTYYGDLLATVATDTALYSAYDAFYGGAGDGAGALLAAPFRPTYLQRATTWLPLLVRAALIFDDRDGDWAIVTDDSIGPWEIGAANVVRYGAVAVGEEAFFRGVANQQLTRAWGTIPGVAASSLLFGLGHTGRAGTADVAGATAFGAYLGTLHVRNGFELGEGVAIHFWWNFLTAVDYLRNGANRDDTVFPLANIRGRF
jgi:membrane protease YdiL (CAAX protease family)